MWKLLIEKLSPNTEREVTGNIDNRELAFLEITQTN